MRLRTTLTVVVIGIAAIAVGVALALVALTSVLYETSLELRAATERVRVLMELESHTLQQVRRASAGESSDANAALESLWTTLDPALRTEFQHLETMITSVGDATVEERERRLEDVIRELRSVAAREDENVRRAMETSAFWNRMANYAGIGAVVILLPGIAAALAWLWRGALQPLVTVVEAIGRFAKGDTRARAEEEGPTEIRQTAVAFNDMARSLARQREQQLAFIGGVAHDLRTPLDALQVAVALLDQGPSDPARVRDRIRRQIERLKTMIGDLLDRTRIESGQFELRPEPCDLRDLITRTIEIHRDSAPMRTFSLSLPGRMVPVRCDPLRMEQVVNNLVANAAKYSPESSSIEIGLECDDRSARLSVIDHGIGMSAADCARIFEPFARGRNVGSIGGSGLGLSVTRKIVEAHAGRIDVRSEAGSGSVFLVTLPLAPPRASVVTAAETEGTERTADEADRQERIARNACATRS